MSAQLVPQYFDVCSVHETLFHMSLMVFGLTPYFFAKRVLKPLVRQRCIM